MLLNKANCIVRIYCISGYNFASRDVGGQSDPYLILRIGKKEFSDRKNYQMNEPNPLFNKSWDFETVFPGCAPLEVLAMDHDMLFGDDLIGSTLIDLEDRYFLPEWNAIAQKPVEFRPLYHPTSQVAQGVLKCWIEIVDGDKETSNENIKNAKNPKWDISAKPTEEYQIRVCVFDGDNVKMMDSGGTVDCYFRCYF